MRLGQLSRKIGVQPSRISAFLEGENYTLEAGSNSKLTEEQELLVKTHFEYAEEEVAPAIDIPIVEEKVPETNTETIKEIQSTEQVEEETATIVNVLNEEIIETEVVEVVNDDIPLETELTDNDAPVEDEVIRAPKLKLEGLKVVGKIDLPEPKIKEDVTEAADLTESSDAEISSPKTEDKPVRKKINQSRNRKPQKRTLTLEEKQSREERAKKRRSKQLKEKQKQLKAAHYESKMRERKPVSSKKNKRKSSKGETEEYIQKVDFPAPKTLFGKFMRWLNT